MILADLGLDDVTIVGALLHDSVEDTDGHARRSSRTGSAAEVAAIVDGVTKLDRLQFDSKEAQQAATLRKMLVAMAKDIRVLLIKLADRLHNMRTIASLPEAKQRRIAQEIARRVRAARAPARHRRREVAARGPLVRGAVPEAVRRDRADGRGRASPEREERAPDGAVELRDRLADLDIDAQVSGPPEALLVDLREDGRARQGVRRGAGPRRRARRRRVGEGLLRRARARSTRCGHRCRAGSRTTSRCPSSTCTSRCTRRSSGPKGKPVEVQIRTQEMHRRAEFGIAAHWGYKERSPAEDLAWLQRMVDWQQDDRRPVRVHGDAEDRPRAGRGLRLHAEGQGHHARRRAPRRSTSRTRSTPRSGTVASARGSTGGSCRSTRALDSRRHRRDLHQQGGGRRPEPRLAAVRPHAAGEGEDPPVVLTRAPGRRDRDRA